MDAFESDNPPKGFTRGLVSIDMESEKCLKKQREMFKNRSTLSLLAFL